MKTLSILVSVSLFVVGLLCSASGAAAELPPYYQLTPLGILEGDNFSQARSINDAGQVVGYSASPGFNHAFLWDAISGMQDLGTLQGASSFASGINNQGTIVGSSGGQGFQWTQASKMLPIPNCREAMGINNNGDIAGQSTIGRVSIWNKEGWMRDLGALETGDRSFATAISDIGVVVGLSNRESGAGGVYWAFVWDELNGIRRLSSSLYQDAAYGINNNGLAVGYTRREMYGSGYDYATLFDIATGDAIDLGGNRNSLALGINDLNQVVGSNIDQRAFVWTRGSGLWELNGLLDSTGDRWILKQAWDINNRGQIVGYGINPSEQYEAFLLTPVPEPTSLLALASGLIGLGGMVYWRRKR